MEKVAVLLSTYNGEKYIREQIDSLINQTYNNIDIYIRDDGSKDQTLQILKEYKEKYSNINLEAGQNVGFIRSFFKLLDTCDNANYYAYCDQDDVWESDKIEKAVNYLSKADKGTPTLFFSNADYYNEKMEFVGKAKSKRLFNFRNSLVECVSQGMTMVINSCAREIICKDKPKECLYHDWWTYMICSGFGQIIYCDESLVRYRRTGKNVTAEGSKFLPLLWWRFKKFILEDNLKKIRKQHIEFMELYGDKLDKRDKKVLSLFAIEKYSFGKAVKKLFYPKRFRKSLVEELMVRILFLLGKI